MTKTWLHSLAIFFFTLVLSVSVSAAVKRPFVVGGVTIDPSRKVADAPLTKALEYFEKYKNQFSNQKYIVVIDFSKHSSQRRFFLINMEDGSVAAFRTSHGSGSDPSNTGYAQRFSNVEGSKASSLGFYRTLNTYYGQHGYSLRLQGLSPTNSNAYTRAIVVHGAKYVYEDRAYAGRSWGCPALDDGISTIVINKIKDGALMYAWTK